MLTRKVQLNLNSANQSKKEQLNSFMDETIRVYNVFIDELWKQKQFHSKYAGLKTDTWLSASMQDTLSNQALQTVKSQRKKRKKSKPVVTGRSIILKSHFVTFREDENSFDFWIRLTALGNKLMLNIPARKHRHFNKFRREGWTLKKSIRLRQTNVGWFADVFFEKEEPPKNQDGVSIGLDCGYKKLAVCSDGQTAGEDLEETYEKISRKQQGSKAFKRSLTERDNKINQSINKLNLSNVSKVVVEKLHNVKKNSKGKIRKQFNNKLQRWSYRKVFVKLSDVCERTGVQLLAVDPAFTSQTCSSCGCVDKKSRKGETFRCTQCGMSMDADYNASKNILLRGICSPPSLQPC